MPPRRGYSAPRTPSPTSSLATSLARLDQALTTSAPDVARSLRKPAAATKLARLEKTAGALPPEVRTWFAWRDGQSAQPTLDAAWRAIGNDLFPFRATPDAGMEHCLHEERVSTDGEAAHVGLFEKHEPRPPLAAKKKG